MRQQTSDTPLRDLGQPLLTFVAVVAGSLLTAAFLLAGRFAGIPVIRAEALAALLTAGGLLYTWHADRKRRQEAEIQRLDRAAYLAIAFDHELHMVGGNALVLGQLVRERRINNTHEAMLLAMTYFKDIKIPLLREMCARLDPFDGRTAAAMMKVVTGVQQADRTIQPTPDQLRDLTVAEAKATLRLLVRTARLLKRDAAFARTLLMPYLSRVARQTSRPDVWVKMS